MKVKQRDHLKDLGVDGRIILMWILNKSDRLEDLNIDRNMKSKFTFNKWNRSVWSRLIVLKIGTNSAFFLAVGNFLLP